VKDVLANRRGSIRMEQEELDSGSIDCEDIFYGKMCLLLKLENV